MHNFFGQAIGYKEHLLSEIFDLVYHSNGGFTYFEVYNMPTVYRKYFFKKLKKIKDDENKELNKNKIHKR